MSRSYLVVAAAVALLPACNDECLYQPVVDSSTHELHYFVDDIEQTITDSSIAIAVLREDGIYKMYVFAGVERPGDPPGFDDGARAQIARVPVAVGRFSVPPAPDSHFQLRGDITQFPLTGGTVNVTTATDTRCEDNTVPEAEGTVCSANVAGSIDVTATVANATHRMTATFAVESHLEGGCH